MYGCNYPAGKSRLSARVFSSSPRQLGHHSSSQETCAAQRTPVQESQLLSSTSHETVLQDSRPRRLLVYRLSYGLPVCHHNVFRRRLLGRAHVGPMDGTVLTTLTFCPVSVNSLTTSTSVFCTFFYLTIIHSLLQQPVLTSSIIIIIIIIIRQFIRRRNMLK